MHACVHARAHGCMRANACTHPAVSVTVAQTKKQPTGMHVVDSSLGMVKVLDMVLPAVAADIENLTNGCGCKAEAE